MKKLLFVLLLFPLAAHSQTDFNYEFVTATDAKIFQRSATAKDTAMNVEKALLSLNAYFPCRVIKHYNHLLIVSPVDYSNVRYEGRVTFVGLQMPFEGWMEYLDERGNRVRIDPVRQLVQLYEKDKLKAQYGRSFF